jgi:hypothetical protein
MIMANKFHIEPGKCYCLTSDGKTICFKVTGWNGSDYIIKTLDGNPITLHDLTKGGLSGDYDLKEIECPKI